MLPAFLTDPVGTAWVGLQVYWARNPADFVSGETITYQYDALKRLVSANSTPVNGSSPPAWTQSYRYDGFGNLTAKVLNGNTTTIPVTAATNQLSSASYDVNGNMISGAGAGLAYDEANRISGASPAGGGSIAYAYDAANKQIYRDVVNGSNSTESWTFYGAKGEKLGVYSLSAPVQQRQNCSGYNFCPWIYTFQPISADIWFAGSLIWEGGSDGTGGTAGYPVYSDRLGTNRLYGARFYPYGDEITSTPNDHEKFATYTRDSYTGLDYADQRYYASTYGNFTTPDPSMKNVDYQNPLTWNAYTYANGDPINANDPSGLDVDIPISSGGNPNSCLNQTLIPWMTSQGMSLGNNFGNLANSNVGALGLTEFFEDEGAISTLYSDFAQVVLNRYWLDQSNPALANHLGLPSGSFVSVVRATSTVWENGDLNSSETNQITSIMNSSIVGKLASGNASRCNRFISALNVASNAVSLSTARARPCQVLI